MFTKMLVTPFICEGQNFTRITSIRGEVWANKTNLTSSLFVIKVPVSSQKSELCICVLGVSIWHLFLQFSEKTLELLRCYVAIFYFSFYLYISCDFRKQIDDYIKCYFWFLFQKNVFIAFPFFFYYLL